MKLVTLQYAGWHGFVSYTGIGQWAKQDTSEFILEWLTGLDNASFDDVVEHIRARGNEWLRKIEISSRRYPHTFILAGFETDQPVLALISNFEDCFGRNDVHKPAATLTISPYRFLTAPRVVVTGWKPAVPRVERRRLERFIREASDEPARIRRRLAEMNAKAASSREAQGMISEACSVVSFRVDGQGVNDIEGPVEIRSLSFGTPMPDRQKLTKLLGFDVGHIGGMTFASSKSRIPFARCKPRVVVPDGSSGYMLREATHKELASCRALDVSDMDVVIGDGSPPDQPGDSIMWISSVDGEPVLCGFIVCPHGINDTGEIAAQARMDDGSEHAVLWKEEQFIDLGCFRGRDSGAVAINVAGLVVGWVCIDSVNRGQINNRPAAWLRGSMYVLETFGCDWGQAVDVNDEGIVLVVGYVGNCCRAIQWNPLTQTTEIIGGMIGIYPSCITTRGVVLGTSRDRDGKSVAWLAKPGEHWKRVDTEPGFYATNMNDVGDIVGAVKRDGYEKPWLKRASGEIIWLPYFDQHWCRPSAINKSGVIVGTAQTDHGTHALIWKP